MRNLFIPSDKVYIKRRNRLTKQEIDDVCRRILMHCQHQSIIANEFDADGSIFNQKRNRY
jgi:hypothetical protein